MSNINNRKSGTEWLDEQSKRGKELFEEEWKNKSPKEAREWLERKPLFEGTELFEAAQELERKGEPCGQAYKEAAIELMSDNLRGTLWKLDYRGRNQGPSKATLARIEFLREVVEKDQKPHPFDPQSLGAEVAENHEIEARKLWPKDKSSNLAETIMRFAGRSEYHKVMIFGPK
jgi:hypothetical protein